MKKLMLTNSGSNLIPLKVVENCVVIVSYRYMMIVSNFGPANVQIHV